MEERVLKIRKTIRNYLRRLATLAYFFDTAFPILFSSVGLLSRTNDLVSQGFLFQFALSSFKLLLRINLEKERINKVSQNSTTRV